MSKRSIPILVAMLILATTTSVFAQVRYFIQGGDTNGKIVRSNLDGTSIETIVGGLSNPRDFALDLAGGKVYWTEHGSGIPVVPFPPAIRRCNLDGTGDVEDLVLGISKPTAIALDLVEEKLYFTTNAKAAIYRANLDGSDFEEVEDSLGQFLESLTIVTCEDSIPAITTTDPPNGQIDARQDRSAESPNPQGIDRIRVRFDCPVTDQLGDPLTADNFEVIDTAGTPPGVLSVTALNIRDTAFEILFTDPIALGEWTTVVADVYGPTRLPIEDDGSNQIVFGFLPGDVNGNGVSTANDILDLIDAINPGNGRNLPALQTDVNRSGETNGQDILRLIDLLNGVNTTRAWIAASLPEKP